MYYFSKDWSSRYLLCLTVSLMNFLVKGFILNDVNNSFNFLVPVKSLKPAFPSASNHSGFPSFTMARCERQHPANCCFLQAVNLSQFFFFFQKNSLKKLAASNGTFILHQQLTFQICSVYRSKHDSYANRFHQIREMKSNRLLFLLNRLPPTRILDSKIKTSTSVSRVLMT